MATEENDDGMKDSHLANGIILGCLVMSEKRTAAVLFASEFLGIDPEKLDALLFQAMTRMLAAAQEWAREGTEP